MVLMVLVVGLHVNQALAQVDQGAISGVVEDSSGAIVVGARVTLTDADTGLTQETTSNKSGIYTFSPIKIGKYSVSAAAAGFKTTVQANLQVNIQDRLSVPLTLSPGAADVTITVTNQLPVLQAESGEVGQVITVQAIVDIPLLNRNWVYMAQLTPGVVPSPGTRGGAAGDYEANGQRAEQNNYVLVIKKKREMDE